MANNNIELNSGTGGSRLATDSRTRSAQTVHVQQTMIGGLADTEFAEVKNAAPAENLHGVVVRQPTFGVSTDAEATGDGTLIAILKRCRTLLGSILSGLTGSGCNVTSGTSAGATAFQIVAARTGRTTLIIQVSDSVSGLIYLGHNSSVSNSGANKGIELQGGNSLELRNFSGALFAITPSGAGFGYTVLESGY